MRYIGDVHGKFKRYSKIIEECSESVQVGDMGIGFRHYITGSPLANPPYNKMISGNHRFIRGNHDNPNTCRNHKMWIKDGTVEDSTMYIGGALSIDKHLRHEGYDWWSDEELSYTELSVISERYCDEKPKLVVSHECPEIVARTIFSVNIEYPSITRQAFQTMFEMYRPEVWIFGHWHQSKDMTILGTRFICLNELEYVDL